MWYFNGLLGFLTLGLWIFCVVDVVVTDEASCRNMPKGLWLLLVLLVPLVGSIVWLVAGRPQTAGRARAPRGLFERDAPEYPEYNRPGRFAATDPAADEEFLRKCRERAEAQRRAAREKRGDS
ncbi:PLDc N-terminal domain-containing protein [Amycolatopsis sp. NPDC059021]|uniref:PLDc N-terminal domain-containing protein n=1 Tax=Amycolatopsis sp. NPDC059021 TaxID=3346704 RepID=UPI0036720A29